MSPADAADPAASSAPDRAAAGSAASSAPDRAAMLGTIESAVAELGLDHVRSGESSVVVALPGEKRLKTACWLTVGRHALEISAFVMRRPDENVEQVYAYLLQRNARMFGVCWAVDSLGDVYLTGHLPLAVVTAAEIDRVLGSVLSNADGSFNTLLELGFGSAIRREWAWRVRNGESLANLAAFADFAQRPAR